ncbi:uncharacterized protein LOC111001002 [Pieris rapae]|uniref:uncharacterized protein LOC111001002 n=1 Tax=Pieris rapae TaxID=64459 RepID=UPI001E27ADB8|nr:uncharacterized protein LOC111001002 [Pieris rapae]
MLVLLFYTCITITITSALPGETIKSQGECPTFCEGLAYKCIKGQCYCANGFAPNYYQTQCVKCPGLGEACYGPCCGDNITLHCWNGVCQSCYGPNGNWVCRDSVDHIVLVSGTQIVMASALVLGIIATFVLLYKLCAATTIRPVGRSVNGSTDGGRLSVGSLQIYVDERLRDAPPRYTRTAPSESLICPAPHYLNSGFIHDNSLPPPAYTPPERKEESPNGIVHM